MSEIGENLEAPPSKSSPPDQLWRWAIATYFNQEAIAQHLPGVQAKQVLGFLEAEPVRFVVEREWPYQTDEQQWPGRSFAFAVAETVRQVLSMVSAYAQYDRLSQRAALPPLFQNLKSEALSEMGRMANLLAPYYVDQVIPYPFS